MDVSEYERFTEKIEMLEDLLEAKQQVEQGKTCTLDEARKKLKTIFLNESNFNGPVSDSS